MAGKPIDYNKTVCFICEKERDDHGDRNLIAVSTPGGREKTVHKKAKELNDDAMLFKIKGHGDTCIDMVANNFHYHRSCMNRYSAKRAPTNTGLSKPSPHDEAFSALAAEISEGLLTAKHVYSINQLSKRYNALLTQYGKGAYRTDRLVKRIVEHLGGEKVQVVNVKNSAILCSSSLTVKELCDQVLDLRSHIEECELLFDSEDECVGEDDSLHANVSMSSYLLAKRLRSEVKAFAKDVDVSEVEISYGAALSQIPVNLYNHLAWLLFDTPDSVGENERVDLPNDRVERVLSLAQDIVGLLSKQPTPKQVGLALHVLKETRSKNLVTTLNRLGHSVSYTSAQRYLTTAANEVSEKEENEGIFIPAHVVPGCFIQTALDNLNFHSETEDGGSLDATTNIIYQYYGEEDSGEAGKVPYDPKQRRRTIQEPEKFQPVKSNLTLKDRKEARSLRSIDLGEAETQDIQRALADENIVWFLLRMFPTHILTADADSESEQVPTWNAFFELYSGKKRPKTKIGYGPMYPQTPTDPDVVKTSLDYFVSLNLKLGQSKTVITCDQAIYDIIKGLVKNDTVRYKDVVLRLGGFHIVQNFLGSIGFLMRESGIEDLLVAAEVCGRGTANKVMAGKDYYKMVRYHSWLGEAFFMLMWEAFEQWLLDKELDNHMETLSAVSALLELIRKDCEQQNKDSIQKHVDQVLDKLHSLLAIWDEFQNSLGKTAKLWGMYIDMVLICKRYVNAERAGHWEQHLIEARNMLPYTVSSGHSKYMSCLPIYLNEMRNLSDTAPEVHKEFESGNFAVRQTSGSFNGVWTDLALEQTYNKEGKTSLFKGITQSETAREKYIKTLPFMTAVSESMKEMVHMQSPDSDHHEKLTKDDLIKVLKIKDTVTHSMRNPFASDVAAAEKLVNIATGEILTSSEVVESRKLGLDAIAQARNTDAEKIISPKILTFAGQQKSAKKKKDTVKQIISEEGNVTRALCFTQELTEEGKIEAFSYEWCKYPPCLFEPDKNDNAEYRMRKGNKADFLDTLQHKVSDTWEPLKVLPPSDFTPVYIIDAMAFVQRFQTLGASVFSQLQERYKEKIFKMKPANCSQVHFVTDRYDFGQMSLKGDERLRREGGSSALEYVPTDNMKIPGWNVFVSNPKNKTNLLAYITSSWTESPLPEGLSLTIGIDTRGICVTNRGVTMLEELCCTSHEEADTRIFAHIASCTQSNSFVIHATDTDIVMLAIYHFPRLPHVRELWIEKNGMYLPIHDFVKQCAEKVGKDKMEVTETLLASYVLSGCDSVSYPFGRGKRRAANVSLQMVGKMPQLVDFSRTDAPVTPTVIDEARDFFCNLYGKPGYSSLDRLRAHMFASSKLDLRALPPTEDAFHQHVLRSLCQLSLYQKASESNPVLLQPAGFGRHVNNNGTLVPVMMLKESKPAAAKLAFCKCKKGCIKNCPCARAGPACIIACSCNGDKAKCGRLTEDSDDED